MDKGQYRPDIDGLRAVAVISVLIFHAFPTVLPGGFIGVDIFFVISGFLITGIIVRSLKFDRFSLAEFYGRRIRRILPALAVVLFASLALGWRIMLPEEFENLGLHTLASAAFAANLAFWFHADYFNPDAISNPLLHIWSLGVEEQFYLIWPLLLWAVFARNRNMVRTLAMVVGVSFIANLVLTQMAPTAAFYSPFTRAWELGIGGLIALLGTGIQKRLSPSSLNVVGVFGLAAILIGVFVISEELSFPGWWAVLPVAGSGALILAGPETPLSRTILSSPPFVFIGLISYPLYLWHWPLLSFAYLSGGEAPSAMIRAALLVLSIILATITYLALERPIRKLPITFLRSAGIVTPMMAAAVCGIALYITQGVPGRFDFLPSALVVRYDPTEGARHGECWLQKEHAFDAFEADCMPAEDDSVPSLLVWGDSHAARLYPGLVNVFSGEFSLGLLARSSCPPMLDVRGLCDENNDYVLSILKENPPDQVLIFAHWARRYEKVAPLDKKQLARLTAAIDDAVKQLTEIGVKKVLVLGPAPYWESYLPNIVKSKLQENGDTDSIPLWIGAEMLKPVSFQIDGHLKKKNWPKNTQYFSVIDMLCTDKGCRTYTPESNVELTTWDYGHLTTSGATFVARNVQQQMMQSSSGPSSAAGGN